MGLKRRVKGVVEHPLEGSGRGSWSTGCCRMSFLEGAVTFNKKSGLNSFLLKAKTGAHVSWTLPLHPNFVARRFALALFLINGVTVGRLLFCFYSRKLPPNCMNPKRRTFRLLRRSVHRLALDRV